MEKVVLDSYPVLALLYNEKGAEKIEKTIRDVLKKNGRIFMCAVNYGEVFYAVMRKSGEKAALKAVEMIEEIPVEIIDADRNMSLIAGSYKVKHKMSYADCFTAALAKILSVPIVTGDPEFQEVEKEIKIIWV